jgi:flagellar biosynthetic protein FlhB
MALFDDGDEDKTEDPTARRLEKAREEGNIAQSPELSSAAQTLGGAAALTWLGATLWERCRALLEGALGRGLEHARGHAGTPRGALALFQEGTLALGETALPVLLFLALVAIVAGVAQRGATFHLERLAPDPGRFDPLSNLGRAFAGQGLQGLALTAAKIVLVLLVVRAAVTAALPGLSALGGTGLGVGLGRISGLGVSIFLQSSVVLVAAGGVDYLLAHRRRTKGLRMSKQEVKEENRDENGDPHVKGRMRRLQRSRKNRRKMLEDAKRAKVVVTNPTHLAIALGYEKASMAAPRVLAKGADLLAAEIREVARQEGIPLVEDKPLARTIYRTVDVGGEVPPKLYQAVAEVLAFVYRLKQRKA